MNTVCVGVVSTYPNLTFHAKRKSSEERSSKVIVVLVIVVVVIVIIIISIRFCLCELTACKSSLINPPHAVEEPSSRPRVAYGGLP